MTSSTLFKGTFQSSPERIAGRLGRIKAYIFDWDGVFNAGFKDAVNQSPFSEVDAMGTNMLRFCHYLHIGRPPLVAIISGEKNDAALRFAKREHLNAVYCGIKHKRQALGHLMAQHNLLPEEVCFFFDDILDLSIAKVCGLRMMVGRDCSPALTDYAQRNNLADYISANDGGHGFVRESAELLCVLGGRYDEALRERTDFTSVYQDYLSKRDEPEPEIFALKDGVIAPAEDA